MYPKTPLICTKPSRKTVTISVTNVWLQRAYHVISFQIWKETHQLQTFENPTSTVDSKRS